MQGLRIIYQDEFIVAVDKPSGFYVHPPESGREINLQKSCLQILRNQLGKTVYPVHRLDRATSGILIFALDSETNRRLKNIWQKDVKKTYACLARGWMDSQIINLPLQSATGVLQDALTEVDVIARLEQPIANSRYSSSRYSLVFARPTSGRFHQIRRHFAHLSHPLIGDKQHGDREHNRIFREQLGLPQFYLRAMQICLPHPYSEEPLIIRAKWDKHWHKLFDFLGLCGFLH